MPRSPGNLTVASFLKKAPDIPSQSHGKRRGKKRMLSTSPNSANLVSSKKLNDQSSDPANDSALSQPDNLGPPPHTCPPHFKNLTVKGNLLRPPLPSFPISYGGHLNPLASKNPN